MGYKFSNRSDVVTGSLPWDENYTVPVVLHTPEQVSRAKNIAKIVRSAEIIVVDFDGPTSAYEDTQLEYEGVDRRDFVTTLYDDDLSEVLPSW